MQPHKRWTIIDNRSYLLCQPLNLWIMSSLNKINLLDMTEIQMPTKVWEALVECDNWYIMVLQESKIDQSTIMKLEQLSKIIKYEKAHVVASNKPGSIKVTQPLLTLSINLYLHNHALFLNSSIGLHLFWNVCNLYSSQVEKLMRSHCKGQDEKHLESQIKCEGVAKRMVLQMPAF